MSLNQPDTENKESRNYNREDYAGIIEETDIDWGEALSHLSDVQSKWDLFLKKHITAVDIFIPKRTLRNRKMHK